MNRGELTTLKENLEQASDILRAAVKESYGDDMMSAAYRAWKAVQTAAKIANEDLSQMTLPEPSKITGADGPNTYTVEKVGRLA